MLPEYIERVEEGRCCPSRHDGNSHIHANRVGQLILKTLPCFVVNAFVREEPRDSYGVSFPQGTHTFLFDHGWNAMSDGRIVFFDSASCQQLLSSLQTKLDDFDRICSGQQRDYGRSLVKLGDLHLIYFKPLVGCWIYRRFLTKTNKYHPPFL
jgi:hypothetical protein